ncbi:hypothetical protein, partial [Flammeovirga sp. SJP92]|uniref:hypothetical protein n=1 Tax=Flammeovirga sp. SJP92 TaxID=1775430 RepID=UPI000788955A
GKDLVDAFYESPLIGTEVFTYNQSSISGLSASYLSKIPYKRDISTWRMVQITGIIQLFTFKSYYTTSLFFGLWSFLGTWKLIQLFTTLYKHYYKMICIAVLFIPSCIFWSSGIIKEAITTGGIGFFVFYFYKILNKKIKINYIINLIVCFLLIKWVKGATIYVLFPCLGLLIFLNYYQKITFIYKLTFSFLLVISIPLSFYIILPKLQVFIQKSEEFNSAQSTISGFQGDHGSRSKGHGGGEASTYHLSTAGDLSLLGMLKSFPEAISYTLFRPFPWETSKLVQLIGSFESFAILIMTLVILIKVGPIRNMKNTFNDPNLAFILTYSLLFGFIAGYISFNYGVLQRFKTPIMPFYIIYLIINYSKSNSKLKPFRKKR